MRLRLYHHPDGTRVAYREAGTGPPLVLLHSAMLSHREWEPIVEDVSYRFRLVLPDLPLHGDSEDRPRHAYTPEWFSDVIGGFVRDVLGPRPLVAGHGLGAEIALRAIADGHVVPSRLVLMPNRLHGRLPGGNAARAWRVVARAGAVPGLDRALSHTARLAFRPEMGRRLSARGSGAAVDLVRHAFADVGGNTNLARSWARFAAHWPFGPQPELLDLYRRMDFPVLLLWADADRAHPGRLAEEALNLLPQGQLRVLSGAGYLIAYDDPVGVARELVAFCG